MIHNRGKVKWKKRTWAQVEPPQMDHIRIDERDWILVDRALH